MTRAKKRFGCRQGKNGATRNQECPLARKSCRAALFASPWSEGKTKEEFPDAAKLEMKTPKTEEAENTEEVVKDSQEMYAFPITEVKQSDDFDSKMDMIFSLYERYSGERCQLPERTNCPLRDVVSKSGAHKY
ncbi:hypothetical protein COOONC_16368 [Cooperia oncophora]